jgi:hypothetical protein
LSLFSGRKEESRIDRCTTALSASSARSGSLRDLITPARRRKARCAAYPVFGHSKKKLSARCLRLFPVMLDVVLCRFRRVMRRVVRMPLRGVCVVRGGLVVALFMVCCRFAMMTRRVFVVLRCLMMMLCRLLRHSSSSFYAGPDSRSVQREVGCSLAD